MRIRIYSKDADGKLVMPKTYKLLSFEKQGLKVESIHAKGFIGDNIPWILPYGNIGTIVQVNIIE